MGLDEELGREDVLEVKITATIENYDMEVTLQSGDIHVAHHIGRTPQQGKIQPVIVRFCHRK